MYLRLNSSRALIVLFAASCSLAQAGDFTDTILTGDSNSGINSGLTYTAKVDFNGGATTINGVSFTDTGTAGTGYALTTANTPFSGYANSLAGNMNGVAGNFFYTGDGSGNAAVTLTGLTPGQQYVTSFYNTAFGGSRYVNITPTDTGVPFLFNEDATLKGAGNVLRYSFTAPAAGTITYNFDAVSNGDSFHFYGMTNAVRNDSLSSYVHFSPTAPTVTRVAGSSNPFTVSNTDLLQTSLSGIVTTGNFNREPILGPISVLANGNFSITGVGANNPELVTGENNASVTFNLDITTNTLGYNVTSIAGYGGWNDAGRDQQRYSIFFSTVGSSDFTLYGQLDDNPASPVGISAVRAVFTGLATGVDAIRIDFLDGVENGYVGYGEFDVFGTATIPEPSSMAGLLLCGAAFAFRRRK